MKIISGSLKNRQIVSPKDSSVRPTTDKVRGAVFSSLFDAVEGADVLDLFCGTGSFGLEAISRGAVYATFVDVKTDLVKKNSQMLDRSQFRIVKAKAESFLESAGGSFDLIFIDPPYGKTDSLRLLNSVVDNEVLAKGGIIIYEESMRTDFAYPEGRLELFSEKKYGDTKIYYLSVKR